MKRKINSISEMVKKANEIEDLLQAIIESLKYKEAEVIDLDKAVTDSTNGIGLEKLEKHLILLADMTWEVERKWTLMIYLWT